MAFEQVQNFFAKQNLQDRIQLFDCSSATVELAAIAIGCEPQRIAKSLSFLVNEKAVLVVVSGDRKIDNSKFKAEFKTKATMLSSVQCEQLVGHSVGGVCPFVLNDGVQVYLDISMQRFDYVYPACGSSNSVIKLFLPELENLAASVGWIDVTKPIL